MKTVINVAYGRFGLSEKGILLYKQKTQIDANIDFMSLPRSDPNLVAVVEELDNEANCPHSQLVITDIPDEYVECQAWEITNYFGAEIIRYRNDKVTLYRENQRLLAENQRLLNQIRDLELKVRDPESKLRFCSPTRIGMQCYRN